MRPSWNKIMILTLCLFLAGMSSCKKEPAGDEGAAKPAATSPEGNSGSVQATGTADTEEPEAPETAPETSASAESAPAEGGCTYSTDPASIQLEWTAYKFTEKTPVKGTFTTANVSGPTSATSLAALAEGLRMDIDGATIESGDPGRNATVKDFFFGKFNPPFKLEAVVKSLSGSETAGNLTIEINMNGVVKEVPFAYTGTPEGEITAKSGINLMDWNLQNAFDSIHKACEQLHTGKDGVSKTWDVVDLKLQAKVQKQNCP